MSNIANKLKQNGQFLQDAPSSSQTSFNSKCVYIRRDNEERRFSRSIFLICIIMSLCNAISGRNHKVARNYVRNMLNYFVLQMRKFNSPKGFQPASCISEEGAGEKRSPSTSPSFTPAWKAKYGSTESEEKGVAPSVRAAIVCLVLVS